MWLTDDVKRVLGYANLAVSNSTEYRHVTDGRRTDILRQQSPRYA